MKLTSDVRLTAHAINAQGPGYVSVGGRQLSRSCLVHPGGIDEQWGPADFAGLDRQHIAALVALPCDVLLLGTGSRQRFPARPLLAPALAAGRSIEAMDTAAACRTYNILLNEGRAVAAALIVE